MLMRRTQIALLMVGILFVGCDKPKAKAPAAKSPEVKVHEKKWGDTGKVREKGAFQNGLRHGEWTSWYKNGNTVYKGSYVAGKKEGQSASSRSTPPVLSLEVRYWVTGSAWST